MAINPRHETEQQPSGDYVVMRGDSSVDAIKDATLTLAHQGCRRVRAQVLDDGRMIVHGYLREYA